MPKLKSKDKGGLSLKVSEKGGVSLYGVGTTTSPIEEAGVQEADLDLQ